MQPIPPYYEHYFLFISSFFTFLNSTLMKKLMSLLSSSALILLLGMTITPVQAKNDKDKDTGKGGEPNQCGNCQGNNGNGKGNGGPNGGPTDAPIDGGASLLLAGGAAYALRRINKARLNKKAQL
ncbi:PID-CTERM protein-sorting domain-containing protein [Hymenobacter radiodurans]|uniref:PID-CTERM protein-sorting domain-containing protein n=1 Tax=Hymenobacter radiodurans TaxID=2496028 RepID=UPI00105915AB|nr:hypothetical protein [Hymenobacter radiodurans]